MKTMIKSAAVLAVICLLASPAMANMTVTLGNATTTGWTGVGGGGRFSVTVGQGSTYAYWNGTAATVANNTAAKVAVSNIKFIDSGSQLWSYCVDEATFSPGTAYTATVDDLIKFDMPGQNSVLTTGTKRAFAKAYAGLYDTGIADVNRALQAFFWDQQLANSDGTTFYNQLSAAQQGYYNGFANDNVAGIYENSVVALNLWQSGTPYVGNFQSQLAVLVPAPGAAVLAFLGLGIVGWVKRRMA